MHARYLNEKGLKDDGKRESSSEISHRASIDAKFKVRLNEIIIDCHLSQIKYIC